MDNQDRREIPVEEPIDRKEFKLISAAETDRGREKSVNEDSVLALEAESKEGVAYGLYMVADGMGGHGSGDEVSQRVVKFGKEKVFPYMSELVKITDDKDTEIAKAMRLIVKDIKEDVWKNLKKGGTTLTMALVINDEVWVINVGDSRAYLVKKDGGFKRITRDDSYVEILVESKAIKPEDRYVHPDRNIITKLIGYDFKRATGQHTPFDFKEGDLKVSKVRLDERDRLLLCSDGLWEEIGDDQIQKTARQGSSQQAAKKLIKMANDKGGRDNISAVVVSLE